jgi:hypothetical protein
VAIAYKDWLGVRFNDAKPTLYAVAYGCFFGVGFCFEAMAAALLFFYFSIKKSINLKEKNKCAASAVGTKTMTKKQPAPQPNPFYLLLFCALEGG